MKRSRDVAANRHDTNKIPVSYLLSAAPRCMREIKINVNPREIQDYEASHRKDYVATRCRDTGNL